MRLKGLSKLLVLLMLALLIPGVIMAATGKVRGIVKNAKTGELLMGANVVIHEHPWDPWLMKTENSSF